MKYSTKIKKQYLTPIFSVKNIEQNSFYVHITAKSYRKTLLGTFILGLK